MTICSTTAITATGLPVNLAFLGADDVRLTDIAVGLSHIRRFNGATTVGYSVAAHSLHVSDIVRRLGGTLSAQLAALHHDAHEYLLGDITSPVKTYINLLCNNALHSVEAHLQRQVLKALMVHTAFVSNRQLIHRADMIALATEKRDLKPTEGEAWPCLEGVLPDFVDCHDRATLVPDDAWASFYIERDRELREAMAEHAQMMSLRSQA
jgi:hypothetical protein